jgi:hypothetical protein
VRSLLILPNSVVTISDHQCQGAAVSSPPVGDLEIAPSLIFALRERRYRRIAIRSSVPIVARE